MTSFCWLVTVGLICLVNHVHSSTVIVVNSVPDTAGSASNCYPVSTSLCNLRSAWAACTSLISTSCTIQLPVNGQLPITLGQLVVPSQNGSISIIGQNATVYASTSGYRFLYYSESASLSSGYPTISLTDFTIQSFTVSNANGGGVYASGLSHFVISNCQFVSNSAANGGSIFANNSVNFMVNGCSFSHSTASTGNGGAINIGTMTGAVVMNSSFSFNQASGNGGSITLDKNCQHARIMNNKFYQSSAGGNGGGINIGLSNYNTTISGSTFNYCTGGTWGWAGDINLDTANIFTHITQCKFYNSHANYGGALFFNYNNNHSYVSDSLFEGNTARTDGGAMYMFNINQHIYFTNCDFKSCRAADGGVMYARNHNLYIGFSGCTFDNCSAPQNGGALAYYDTTANCFVTDSKFTNCVANQGAAIYAYTYTDDFLVNNTVIANSHTYVNGAGGAMMFYLDNMRVTLNNVTISNVTSTNGGAIELYQYNSNFTISNSLIENAVGANGGGIMLDTGNNNFTMINTVIRNCRAATGYGGGVYILNSNNGVNLVTSTLVNNTAKVSGGGVALMTNNDLFTIAGSQLTGNKAVNAGGGLYSQTNSYVMKVIDLYSYQNFQILQTSHPYKSGYSPSQYQQYVVFNQSVAVPNAIGYILMFDAQTNINTQDFFAIYTNPSKTTILFQATKAGVFPGKNAPALVVNSSTYYVEFDGLPYGSQNLPTSYSQNYYGFTLYSTPHYGS